MLKRFKSFYIEPLFYWTWLSLVFLLVFTYLVPALYLPSLILILALSLLTLADVVLLYSKKQGVEAHRQLGEKLSNGDFNAIQIELANYYSFKIHAKIIDELPVQLQERNFLIKRNLDVGKKTQLTYHIRPSERGEYHFGRLLIFISSPIRLVSRRYTFDQFQMAPVYPSFVQLKKFDLIVSAYRNEFGLKKIRRIGHTMEFEQIKDYVLGDDMRTINWNATAKKNQLMVNQFQDEKSQPVYSIIDKGRSMKMPFNQLSLLDYSINASLVMSNTILKKHDKAGMFTFSKKVENRIVAAKRSGQMHLILENLYNIKTDYSESDFGVLYGEIKRKITQRSLLFLYTNFETLDGMERQLAYLQAIAKQHVLVVVFFVNTELEILLNAKSERIQNIYQKTIAQKFTYEKRLIVKELRRRGVATILTKPEDLTLNVINKYLEIKARGHH
ncbi:MAG: DUF58 domain-containing protein [Bacteroidales bacterium]|nr:DUF58 domain-containing protein [Bacteroidales bacterium]